MDLVFAALNGSLLISKEKDPDEAKEKEKITKRREYNRNKNIVSHVEDYVQDDEDMELDAHVQRSLSEMGARLGWPMLVLRLVSQA